jgi:hypothetical protein
LKTRVCMAADRLWPIGWPITANFFDSILGEGLNGLNDYWYYESY